MARHGPAQAAASVPDKDGTFCSSVQLRGDYFALVGPASSSKPNLLGLRNRLEVNLILHPGLVFAEDFLLTNALNTRGHLMALNHKLRDALSTLMGTVPHHIHQNELQVSINTE